MTRLAALLVLGAAWLGAACGSTSPTNVNIAGSWSGTYQLTGASASTIAFTLSHTGTAVSGNWTLTAGPSITIIGTVNGTTSGSSFSGTMKYTLNGATCTANVAGGAAASSITWTSPGYTGCGAGTAFTVSIAKK